jgi:predicted amidohydrolase YtcJ
MAGDNYRRGLFSVIVLLFMISPAVAQQTVTVPVQVVSYADMVIYNGKVMTMDDASTTQNLGTMGQAMAMRGGKILAVGTDAEILPYVGPKTMKIDLHGRTVIPGIMDSHTHIHNNAVAVYATDHPEVLSSVSRTFNVAGNTYEDLQRGIEVILKEDMAHAPKDQWAYIDLPTGGSSGTGIGPKFLQERGITKQELDKLAPDHPVMVESHPAYTVNSAAMKVIGDIYQSDPEAAMALQGGDSQGLGDFTEYARSLAVDTYFKDKIPLLADTVEKELEKNAALGITTYSSHIVGFVYMDAFMKLVRENRMPIRFGYTDYFGFEGNPDPSSFYLRLRDMAGLGTPYFWQSGAGLQNIDSGPPMFCSTMEAPPEVKKREWCRNAPGTAFAKAIYTIIRSRERLTVGHAYGDKGIDYILQTVDQVMKDDPTITLDYIRSRRFSSDHCGFWPRPAQIPELKKLNWIVSCNGSYVNRSAPWLKVYGQQYGKWIAPVKSLIDAGVTTVFENEEAWSKPPGSNYPNGVYSNTYFGDAYLMLTRKNSEGQVIAPEERIDRNTLMKMMTVWQSQYFQKEKELGTLEPGKWADFVVLNKDYFTIPEEEIVSTYPVMTVVGGKPVFWRTEFAAEQGHAPVGYQVKFMNVPKSDPNAAPAP